VADPRSLQFLYYVNLNARQISKAMWIEVSPDGRWLWTSSGTHLLVYRAADMNRDAARRQRAGTMRGITGKDLGAVLPSSGVTGAAFDEDALTRRPRLLLALNRGASSEVISYSIFMGNHSPKLLSRTPRTEVMVPRSFAANESEGLAVTRLGPTVRPLGGVLHWLMLPLITGTSVYSEIFNYARMPRPHHCVTHFHCGRGCSTRIRPGS
jgi:hypothetical protein